MKDTLPDRVSKLSPDKLQLLSKRLKEKGHASKKRGISRRGSEGPAPLSFAQQRLWFLDQLEPGLPVYNVPAAVRLKGRLNVAALERSLSEVVKRHESLRTKIVMEVGRPVQIVAPARPLTLPVVDLQALPETQAADVAGR